MRTSLISVAVAAILPSLAAAQEVAPQAPAPLPAQPSATPPAKPKPADGAAGRTVGEVVVTGEAAVPVQTSIDRKSYDVTKDLQAQSGAITDALRNVPSVQVDVQGNVSLRGDGNVTILIDGKPSSLFQGDNKAQALQSLPADSIARVEVITNPSAEFQSDGSAGIINLITKHSKGLGFTGSVRGTVGDELRANTGVSLGYNSDKLTVSSDLSVRRDKQKLNQADDRLTPDPAGGFDGVDQEQVQHFLAESVNARLGVDYDLTPKTRVGFETHGNFTDFLLNGPSRIGEFGPGGAPAARFERDLDIHQKRALGGVSVNLRQKLAGEGDFATSLSLEEINDARTRSGHTLDQVPSAPEEFDRQAINNHQHHIELKGDWTQPLADMSKLKAGFDVDHVDNSYRNRGFAGGALDTEAPDPTLTNLFEFRQTVAAAYVTYERPVGPVTLLAGLRVEDMQIHLDQATLGQENQIDYLRAYPTLHLSWKLADTQQFTASYSHRIQRPDPGAFNSFRLELDPLNFQSGNAHLKPQQTQSFELGYEYRQSPLVLVTTLYYRENRDGFAQVLHDLGGGVFLNERDNAAQSRFAGVEEVASGKITSKISYNLSVNLRWNQLDSLGPMFAPRRSLVSGEGHGSISWQATPNDLVQFNGFVQGKELTPQGAQSPLLGFDLGYRRKLTDKLFLVVTAQDVFHSFYSFYRADTPVLIERTKADFDTRQFRVGFSWSFGGGKPKEPAFEFQNGGGPTP
ncbi:TonB-dependent receptor domain-containing protein [Phenylobacterium sp.]|uniref:TonB-dependent receptor domain-containing protein n=1 Tax=Phenylobacterium sp. TaxID=1871053 RepID=UPI002E37D8C6|nr:TonB-dependent receptor [Phenylobacterium sp.]HEX3366153.1 TonB-dependent receptor [Phenylobacterium sp.]